MAETDGALADRLATETGRLLVGVRPGDGDRIAQDFLAAQLKEHRPDDAVLSEEAPDDPRRLAAGRVWIIDPLDGSREYADAVHGVLVPMGSAGAKAMAVVRGEADAYLHAGGRYEWDSAAPVAVAPAAGLHCSRVDGRPLVDNQPDPWLPDLLICRPELAGVLA